MFILTLYKEHYSSLHVVCVCVSVREGLLGFLAKAHNATILGQYGPMWAVK